MKPSAPCFGCEQRELGCHSTCERYGEFRKALDEYNAIIAEYNAREKMVVDYQVKRTERIKRS